MNGVVVECRTHWSPVMLHKMKEHFKAVIKRLIRKKPFSGVITELMSQSVPCEHATRITVTLNSDIEAVERECGSGMIRCPSF
jgi:hypothetical protein